MASSIPKVASPVNHRVNNQHGVAANKSINLEEIEILPYEIYRFSSFSTNYVPE